jgi:zinc transporter ZupT
MPRRVVGRAQITALTTGLGALPLLSVRSVTPRNIALSNCAAAGMCLAASVALGVEGLSAEVPFARARVGVGALLGYFFILATRAFLERHEGLKFASMKGASAQKTLLLIVVMTAHSFAEGVGIGERARRRGTGAR